MIYFGNIVCLTWYVYLLVLHTAVQSCPPLPQDILAVFHVWTSCFSLLPPAHDLETIYWFQHYCRYELNRRISCNTYVTPYLLCLDTCSGFVRKQIFSINHFPLDRSVKQHSYQSKHKLFPL